MTLQTTKIKNGKLALPNVLQKDWESSEVILLPTENGFFVQKINKPSFEQMESKLKKIGKILTQKDINNAVKNAKRKIYKTCA